ncbi:MFS transporter [Fodinicola feengrottensis]|uniref:MFS transporter n=1 Tax=Fodinicola feengrottensis TaxID=435914 RepID=UPI0031D58D12
MRDSAAFRRLWWGSGLSAIGSQMTTFAVALQVFTLTHSSLAVGTVGLAAAVPAITAGLFGGPVIDAVDRHRLVLLTSSGLAVVSGLFAVQAYANLEQLWLLYALVALQGLLGAVDGPARRTFLARLLPADRVPAGAALTLFSVHLSVTAGPALAGLLAAGWGLKVCYLLDALSFAAALYSIARLPAMRPQGGAARPGLTAVRDGLRFILGNRILSGALLADVCATTLGMPFALFPAINAARFGGGAQTLGLLPAAVAVGGIIGSMVSGPVGKIRRPGRAMLLAVAVWGAGLAGFGLVPGLWPALAMLVLAGAADAISVIFRTSMVQLNTPDQFRGRTSATEYVVGAACPYLGNFRAGAIGSLISPAVSATAGGLAVIASAAVIGLAVPGFARYRAD